MLCSINKVWVSECNKLTTFANSRVEDVLSICHIQKCMALPLLRNIRIRPIISFFQRFNQSDLLRIETQIDVSQKQAKEYLGGQEDEERDLSWDIIWGVLR